MLLRDACAPVVPFRRPRVSYFAELCGFATLREQNFSAIFTPGRQVAKLRKGEIRDTVVRNSQGVAAGGFTTTAGMFWSFTS